MVVIVDLGSQIRTVLRMDWWKEVRNIGGEDRVLEMAREKWHLNCEKSSYSQHGINFAEELLEWY